MFRYARVTALVLCVGLTLGVTACGKKAAEPPPAAAPAAAVSVTAVELGRSIGGDKRVTDKTEQFSPKDVIYASVLTSGASSNTSLKARWTYQDGQVVDESEQSIAPTGDATTEFHISKPDGWPAGKYKVEVSLNGVPAQTKDFEVK
jgi:hypothetical protein